MEERSRLGKDAVKALEAIVTGKWFGRYPAREAAPILERMTGYGVRCRDGRQAVVDSVTGSETATSGDADVERRAQASIMAILSGPPCRWSGPRVTLSAGAQEVIERAGLSLGEILGAHRVLHGLAIPVATGIVSTVANRGHVAVEYRSRSGISWRDGVVSLRTGTLPRSIRLSLRGRRIDEIAEDPLVGAGVVRIACAAPLDGITRIVTTDAGRRLAVGEDQ